MNTLTDNLINAAGGVALVALAVVVAIPTAEARPAHRTIEVALPEVKDTGCRDGQPVAYYYVDPTDGVTYWQGTDGTFTTETHDVQLIAPRGYDLSVNGVNVGTRYTHTLVNHTHGTACEVGCS